VSSDAYLKVASDMVKRLDAGTEPEPAWHLSKFYTHDVLTVGSDDEPTRITIDPVERSRQRLAEAFPYREPWWLRVLRWCVR